MKERKPEVIQARRADGSVMSIVVPRSRIDVENQPDVPAHALAVLAFSQVVSGVRRWSQFTTLTLKRLGQQYGDDALRSALCNLLDDMAGGFRPINPVGILIHRVRATATTNSMEV